MLTDIPGALSERDDEARRLLIEYEKSKKRTLRLMGERPAETDEQVRYSPQMVCHHTVVLNTKASVASMGVAVMCLSSGHCCYCDTWGRALTALPACNMCRGRLQLELQVI